MDIQKYSNRMLENNPSTRWTPEPISNETNAQIDPQAPVNNSDFPRKEILIPGGTDTSKTNLKNSKNSFDNNSDVKNQDTKDPAIAGDDTTNEDMKSQSKLIKEDKHEKDNRIEEKEKSGPDGKDETLWGKTKDIARTGVEKVKEMVAKF